MGTAYPNASSLYIGGGVVEVAGLHVPNTPSVSVIGTPGGTTRRFRIIARDASTNRVISIDPLGNHCVTTTANATLSASNYLHFEWANQYPAPTDFVLVEQNPGDITQARTVATVSCSTTICTYDLTANPGGAFSGSTIPAYNETASVVYRSPLGVKILNAAAPATPAAGYVNTYTDVADKTFKAKDDAGTIKTLVQPDAGAANNFLTAISTAGVPSKAQPSAANLSNGVTGANEVVLKTSPTIVTPTIASFTNATHNHTNAAGGGQLSLAAFSSTTGSGAAVGATSPTLVTPVLGAATATSVTASSFLSSTGGVSSFSKGADVASAATIAATGNLFHVTGTTSVTSVSGSGIAAGTQITIIFDGALTFTDGSNLKLAGNFTTTADDTITLVYDGTNWYEVARAVN
jgi:hypothetical protein